MSFWRFLLGVFLAPLLLGLMFTPLFLLDVGGLTFEHGVLHEPDDYHDEGGGGGGGQVAALCMSAVARRQASIALNVFLYALSLSTTFGGSPVAARSPFSLMVANLNTLMAQFLFVFLSGAVFARMSQPSQPVRCSKKAIIRNNDYTADGNSASHKVFAMRLVLTGPHPTELVDVKVTLTLRLFMRLPSGSIFCSTNDLPLVRPEVAHLKYGLTVRHVIDEKSPLWGHTRESLAEGDASFCVTIVGMERSSMQSIFILQDYFVHDGDVEWNVDFLDFVSINDKGQRVLDHSKLDLIKVFKTGGIVGQAVSRMNHIAARARKEHEHEHEQAAADATSASASASAGGAATVNANDNSKSTGKASDSSGADGDGKKQGNGGEGEEKSSWDRILEDAEEATENAAGALSKWMSLSSASMRKRFTSNKSDSLTHAAATTLLPPLSPTTSFK